MTLFFFICVSIFFVHADREIARAGTEIAVNPRRAKKILSIQPEADDKGLRVHIVADGKLKNYHFFSLLKPLRLVVDLNDVQSSLWYKTLLFKSPVIKTIRLGTSYKNKVRVVFYLSPVSEVLYKVYSKGNHLIVDFGANSVPPAAKAVRQVQLTPTTKAPKKPQKAVTEPLKIGSPDSVSTITSIELETDDQGTKAHILADGKISRYDAFYLLDPPRFVIDLPNVQSSVDQKVWLLDSPLVKKIRLGTSYKDKVRVVFDLFSLTKLPYKVLTQGNKFTVAFGDVSPLPFIESSSKTPQTSDSSTTETEEGQ